jgi:hypothetical protein
MPMQQERRNLDSRAVLVRQTVARIVQNPQAILTVDGLKSGLGVSGDAALRILGRLVSSGVIREVRSGTWTRQP